MKPAVGAKTVATLAAGSALRETTTAATAAARAIRTTGDARPRAAARVATETDPARTEPPAAIAGRRDRQPRAVTAGLDATETAIGATTASHRGLEAPVARTPAPWTTANPGAAETATTAEPDVAETATTAEPGDAETALNATTAV